MPRPRVIVVGSVNTDLVVVAERLPAPGETVTGGAFSRHGGGKGANQAVAAARLGASVGMAAAVGNDDLGREALAALEAEGIDLTAVKRLDDAAEHSARKKGSAPRRSVICRWYARPPHRREERAAAAAEGCRRTVLRLQREVG